LPRGSATARKRLTNACDSADDREETPSSRRRCARHRALSVDRRIVVPTGIGPTAAALRRRALATAGALARYVPVDGAQMFAFVASPSVRADPWAIYQRLHRRGPVRPTLNQAWLVASSGAASDVLRSPTTSVKEALAPAQARLPRDDPFTRLMDRTLLFTDPPDHTRLRRLVARTFTPRTVERLRAPISALVDGRIDRMRPAGSADVLDELAFPLAVDVICELLGVPADERPRFLLWARDIGPRLELTHFRDESVVRRGNEAAAELVTFLDELVADPSRRTPDGLLDQLLAADAADEDGDRLDQGDIVRLCLFLLLAGFEATANLIGNGLLALLQHPDERERLVSGEVPVGVAVDELLRYAGPSQFAQRVLLADTEVGGHELPARTLVALLLGAANRDPTVFAEPDRLDLGRSPNPHLGFSVGIHHCLGAALARLEAGIAITAVLRELPDLRLAARPRWRDTFVIRGLRSLPVRWRTATA
jgi:pimeloyl-[acyl-carrier protein] synthase